FPNPSKGGFFIQLAEDLTITRIIINDISGKTVYNKTHNSNLVSLNLTNQKRGIYIVTVISNNSSTVKKLIIE
ncbi:MAG TPA: T9SS type A sorting domain-containing protein, partial [Prolixibacteraceae bacterium]|nr:T9SS type A sorting domain-containing protein [Prolixibacteraceae bacterium]